MSESQSKFPPVVLVLFAVMLWSTGGLFIKLTTVDAFTVNAGRSLFAAITVAIFTFRKGLKPDLFTLLTSLLYAATLSFFVYATKNTTAANAIFLQYTAPIYILILSPFILKEKFRVSDLITVVFCLAGMSLFFLEKQNASNALAPNVFLGNIAALLSGLFFGLYFILLRHPRSLSKNPAISVFYGNSIIVSVTVIVFLVQYILPETTSSNVTLPNLTLNDLGAIAYLGIFQIGIAYILFTNGIANGVRSLDASIIGFIEPLLNPVWVFIILKEKPSRWAIIGGVIILTAIIFHTLKENRSKLRTKREAKV
jgi:drug/metabolite transporter, DME family